MPNIQPPTSDQQALPESLRKQLDAFRRHLWRIKITEAILAGVFGLFLSYLIVFALDRFVATSPLARLIILLAGVSIFAIFAPFWINRWVLRHRRENQIARLISKHYPGLGDRLLGVIELESQHDDASSMSPRLRAAAMEGVAAEAKLRDLDQALPGTWNKKWTFAVSALASIIIAALIITPSAGLNALKRWIMPLSDIERFTTTRIDPDSIPNPLYIAQGEPFTLNVNLEENSDTPSSGKAKFENSDWYTSSPNDGSYSFKFPAIFQDSTIDLRIGDAIEKIEVKPQMRPTLTQLTGTVTYPSYLQRKPQTIDLTSGFASIVEGSQFQIHARANRPLAHSIAEIIEETIHYPEGTSPEQEDPANPPTVKTTQSSIKTTTQSDRFSTEPITITKSKLKIPLRWRDTYQLDQLAPSTVNIEPLIDQAPSISIQGMPSELFKLEEETISFEILAEDDFGVKRAGIAWEGQHLQASPTAPAKGELTMAKGSPQKTSLSELVDFSFSAYNITPQKLTIRAWTEDYLKSNGRVYSEPLTVYILTKEEHRQLIEKRSKDAINKLEDLMRTEQELLDENKRLERLTGKELQSEANRKKLEEQANKERENADRMKELAKEMEDVLKEASKNGDIDTNTMKKLAETAQKMGDMAKSKMPEIEKKLSDSQDRQNSEEKTKEDVKEAVEKQEKLMQEMQETIEKANEANKQLEAGTFVNRLKQAAKDQGGITGILAQSMSRDPKTEQLVIGKHYKELDPSDQRLFIQLFKQQGQTSSDVRWIQEDLGHFYSRTQKPEHKQILDAMREAAISDKFDHLQQQIRSICSFNSATQSSAITELLLAWAKQLENAGNKDDGGGGGGGGGQEGNSEDEDFEFMLKVMKMIQSERDIRARTRSLEQKRRAMSNFGEPAALQSPPAP